VDRRLEPAYVARTEELTHVNAVRLGELAKRPIGPLLVKDALARVPDVAAAIRGGKVRFLLPPANRFENVRHLYRSRFP
jgi:hypothetical protein